MKKISCEICEVYLGSLVQASVENPKRCEDCLFFEKRIKKICWCGREIFDRDPVQYYIKHGNFCFNCIKEVNQAIIERIRRKNRSFIDIG